MNHLPKRNSLDLTLTRGYVGVASHNRCWIRSPHDWRGGLQLSGSGFHNRGRLVNKGRVEWMRRECRKSARVTPKVGLAAKPIFRLWGCYRKWNWSASADWWWWRQESRYNVHTGTVYLLQFDCCGFRWDLIVGRDCWPPCHHAVGLFHFYLYTLCFLRHWF